MSLPLPHPHVEDQQVQRNFETISLAWPGTTPHIVLYNSVNQNIANAAVTIVGFDTIEENLGMTYVNTAGVDFRIGPAGVYHVTAHVKWAAAAGVQLRYMQLVVNGAAIEENYASDNVTAGQNVTNSISRICLLPANAAIGIGVYQDSGGVLAVQGGTAGQCTVAAYKVA